MTPSPRTPVRATGQAHGTGGSKPLLILWLVALALAFAGFVALGIWQLHRLEWKLSLIERVESRIHAAPMSAPGPAKWPRISQAGHEYLAVRLQGHFLAGHDARVQAVTALGGGFWLLTPFQTREGFRVLVNRGFIPTSWRGDAPTGEQTLIGLLRLSEPGGGFLRHNDPATDHWYSRDVAAIAEARGLEGMAPYFVDAGLPQGQGDSATLAASGPEGPGTGASGSPWPRPGLTVIHFSNNHLGYALTWFVLALMCAGAAVFLVRDARQHGTP